MVFGSVACVLGVIALINAAGQPLFADRGEQLWKLFAMNPAAALLTVGFGLLTLVGAASGKRGPVIIGGAVFTVAAGLTLVAVGRSFNVLGGRASTLSFWLALGVGLLACALSPEGEPEEGGSRHG
jgi:hypothetical protein